MWRLFSALKGYHLQRSEAQLADEKSSPKKKKKKREFRSGAAAQAGGATGNFLRTLASPDKGGTENVGKFICYETAKEKARVRPKN